MTTYEALSLLAQFTLSVIATLSLIITVIVFFHKKK